MAAEPRAVRWSRRVAALCALAFIALYLAVAVARLRYPFELEWMEGASADAVARVLAGRTLYAAPSLAFVPLNYPPVYFYLAAAVSKLTGPGLLPLRLVSLLSSLGCMGVLFAMARREAGTAHAGLLAAGLFAATFRVAGAWFDIARVDSLFLFLFLCAMALVRFGGAGVRAQVLAGLCLALSFFTKQGALAALPVMLLCLLPGRRRMVFLATAAVAMAGGTLLLDRLHAGWYRYFLYELPARHAWNAAAAATFALRDLLRPLPIACLLALIPAWASRRREEGRDGLFFVALALGSVGISGLSRLQPGGWDNVLMPAYASLALLFALGAEAARRPPGAGDRGGPRVLVNLACAVQLVMLAYNPGAQIPTARDRAAGEALVRALSAVKGEVFVPYHGYLPTLAGKRGYAHIWGMDDVIERDPVRGGVLRDEVVAALRERRFAAVVVESDMIESRSWLLDEAERDYARATPAVADRGAFWPVTGIRTRPEWIYLPRPAGGP